MTQHQAAAGSAEELAFAAMQLLAVAVKLREDEGPVQLGSPTTLLLTGHAGMSGIVSYLEVRTVAEVSRCTHLHAWTRGLFALLSARLCACPSGIKLAMATSCSQHVQDAAGYPQARPQQQCVWSCDPPAG